MARNGLPYYMNDSKMMKLAVRLGGACHRTTNGVQVDPPDLRLASEVKRSLDRVELNLSCRTWNAR